MKCPYCKQYEMLCTDAYLRKEVELLVQEAIDGKDALITAIDKVADYGKYADSITKITELIVGIGDGLSAEPKEHRQHCPYCDTQLYDNDGHTWISYPTKDWDTGETSYYCEYYDDFLDDQKENPLIA